MDEFPVFGNTNTLFFISVPTLLLDLIALFCLFVVSFPLCLHCAFCPPGNFVLPEHPTGMVAQAAAIQLISCFVGFDF